MLFSFYSQLILRELFYTLTYFSNTLLDVMEDWSENPQNKAKFKDLEAEVDSVLKQLTPTKQL
ncbi:Acyl-CoA synthetase [Nostoc flagelliforme CCNUN1]|uniref:Acyl-CoA synthetase n=1 Tax=Nostoc flagelliforme CCNUN1 TaxID=2038116 RepID=A0A2K8SIV2_9NOSO|nr:Acyl-CoA synthetase [Nostoc flagelliforme CCNUN1]